MGTLIWLVLLVGTLLTLAYRRTDLKTSTIVLGALLLVYLLVGDGDFLWKLLLIALFALFALLNVEQFRRDNITRRLFGIYRSMLPSMSKTEQEARKPATSGGTASFSRAVPDWRRLKNLPPPKLTPEEQAFSTARPRALPNPRRVADHARARRHAGERVAVPEGPQVLRDNHAEGVRRAAIRRSRAR
jgi:acyl-CoA dehydrogenase